MSTENGEAKNKMINKLKNENQNWSDQVDKLQDSLKSKDEEIGSKNVEIESLKERFKTNAKERCKNIVLIERPVLAKLYAENKKFSDALRKGKEAIENGDKEIENLRDQIDKLHKAGCALLVPILKNCYCRKFMFNWKNSSHFSFITY